MSVIDWSKKPYPWNEIGPQWVAELQQIVTDTAWEPRTVREKVESVDPTRWKVTIAVRGSEALKKGPWV